MFLSFNFSDLVIILNKVNNILKRYFIKLMDISVLFLYSLFVWFYFLLDLYRSMVVFGILS